MGAVNGRDWWGKRGYQEWGRDKEEMNTARTGGFLLGMAYKVRSGQQVKVMRLWLVGAVMPSARLICLSFIGQSRPQGKVSWFSYPCVKAHFLLRTEVPSSDPPPATDPWTTWTQDWGCSGGIGQGLHWGPGSKPLLPHKGQGEKFQLGCGF